eukprot:TRINITY_DN7340_c0_g2_i1.p1 TRINITY_DN7340_c0_g2~~TRINITY_DN7340_c0_g2_i1.p1  ORF type:complete len:993 (+),score=468.33 TRINITY_DN7340_c0_g2_i1:98-2980(+)
MRDPPRSGKPKGILARNTAANMTPSELSSLDASSDPGSQASARGGAGYSAYIRLPVLSLGLVPRPLRWLGGPAPPPGACVSHSGLLITPSLAHFYLRAASFLPALLSAVSLSLGVWVLVRSDNAGLGGGYLAQAALGLVVTAAALVRGSAAGRARGLAERHAEMAEHVDGRGFRSGTGSSRRGSLSASGPSGGASGLGGGSVSSRSSRSSRSDQYAPSKLGEPALKLPGGEGYARVLVACCAASAALWPVMEIFASQSGGVLALSALGLLPIVSARIEGSRRGGHVVVCVWAVSHIATSAAKILGLEAMSLPGSGPGTGPQPPAPSSVVPFAVGGWLPEFAADFAPPGAAHAQALSAIHVLIAVAAVYGAVDHLAHRAAYALGHASPTAAAVGRAGSGSGGGSGSRVAPQASRRALRQRIRALQLSSGIDTPAAEVIRILTSLAGGNLALTPEERLDVEVCVAAVASGNLYRSTMDGVGSIGSLEDGADDDEDGGAVHGSRGSRNGGPGGETNDETKAWLRTNFTAAGNDTGNVAALAARGRLGAAAGGVGSGRKVRVMFDLPTQSIGDELVKLAAKTPGLGETIENLGNWRFDVFSFAQQTSQRPLYVLAVALFQQYGFFANLGLSEERFRAYFTEIERGYRKENPYHNAIHGTDVAQTFHCFLASGGFGQSFPQVEVMAGLWAAAIHDYRHPGVNNAYLVNVNDPVAVTYNNRSVLENMHAAEGLRLLDQDEFNFISDLSKEDQTTIRSTVIDTVLATDMKFHGEYVSKLKTLTSLNGIDPADREHRMLTLQIAIKASDISNPAKQRSLCVAWADRIMEEFFAQGDLEAKASVPVSPFCDRATTVVAKCQVGFIAFVVKPMFQVFSTELSSELTEEIMRNIDDNEEAWKALAAQSDRDKAAEEARAADMKPAALVEAKKSGKDKSGGSKNAKLGNGRVVPALAPATIEPATVPGQVPN